MGDSVPVCMESPIFMNQRIFNRCVEIAKALRPKIKKGKAHHCTFAIKKSKIICIGVNDYDKQHPKHKFGRYEDHKGYTSEYQPCLHSEVSLSIKLGEETWKGLEILNIRIGNNDDVRMSKPCCNCSNLIIKPLNPKKFFYSDNNGELIEMKV